MAGYAEHMKNGVARMADMSVLRHPKLARGDTKPGGRTCDERGCTRLTISGKEKCPQHVLGMPYVQALLADLPRALEPNERKEWHAAAHRGREHPKPSKVQRRSSAPEAKAD